MNESEPFGTNSVQKDIETKTPKPGASEFSALGIKRFISVKKYKSNFWDYLHRI